MSDIVINLVTWSQKLLKNFAKTNLNKNFALKGPCIALCCVQKSSFIPFLFYKSNFYILFY